MTDLLERRYRRLMFVYPKSHRGRWESEILGTLLELAGPAQRMPAGREAASLCLGGLRARVRVDRARSPIEGWLAGVRLAVVLLLTLPLAASIYQALTWLGASDPPRLARAGGLAAVALGASAVALAVCQRYRWASILAVLAGASSLLSSAVSTDWVIIVGPVLIAVLLAAGLRRRPSRAVSRPLLLSTVPLAIAPVILLLRLDPPAWAWCGLGVGVGLMVAFLFGWTRRRGPGAGWGWASG